MPKPLRCRLGIHDYVDFPDPNPESGGLEKQGYRACTRCAKEKDSPTYLSRSGLIGLPADRHPMGPAGQRVRTRGNQRLR